MKPVRATLLALLLAPLATAASAEVTFTPSATYTLPDGRKNYDDEFGYNFSLGYRFTPAFGVELVHGRTESELHGSEKHLPIYNGTDTSDTRTGLDAYYAFMTEQKLSPYVLFGAGQARYKTEAPRLKPNGQVNSTENYEDPYLNGGLGAFYRFNDKVALRSEYRLVYNGDETLYDNIVLVGLEFSPGEGRRAEPAPAPVAPEPAPVVQQAAPVVVVLDSDNDGVPDAQDSCSSTPAGTKVDAKGCPLDSDKDGVADYMDKCPDTKAGAAVDATGCYEVLKQQVSIALDVKFASGKAEIQGDATSEIQKVADFMQKYPNVNVTIEGHTDSRGNATVNKNLSQKRADAVKAELVKLGVDAARLSAVGYGAARPIADNKTEAGRAQNRRVVASAQAQSETIKMKR